MIKWFAYIVTLLIFAPYLSNANEKNSCFLKFSGSLDIILSRKINYSDIDTITTKNSKKLAQDDKGRIKEVTKAKRQPKPEKVEPPDNTGAPKVKQRPQRQRRPEGLERPPEIPRRNGN